MDAERFDSLARVLAAKTPRRALFRGGAGFAAGWLGVARLRAADAAATPPLGHHTLVRQYALTGKVSDARKALKNLVAEIEKSPGFVSYEVVDAGNGVIATISIFNDQGSSAAAAQLEASYIKKHVAKYLPNTPTALEGDAILVSDLVVGCPCTTGVQDPCGNASLTCCAGANTPPGGPGACITAATTCGAPATPTPMPTLAPAPTDTPVPQPTQAPACSANPGDACASDADCCVGSCGQGVCYCVDPSRPVVGCPCTTGDASACGGRLALCCPTEPGAQAAGTCLSPMATCDARTGCRADGYACPTTCTAGQLCPQSEGGCCSNGCLDDGTCGTLPAPVAACADGGAACAGNGDCCSGKCNSSGICYCTDPDRAPIGCPCTAGDANACAGRAELCCAGTCISPMATCGA